MNPQQVFALAQRINGTIDRILETFSSDSSPEERLVVLVGAARALAEFHPGLRELAADQFAQAWAALDSNAQKGVS